MERVIRGVFSVWKPRGLTCQDVASKLRRILQGGKGQVENSELVKRNPKDFSKPGRRSHWLKVGHGGTLDKAAEGVLVIGVGRGCECLMEYQVNTDKGYEVACELGRMTDTLDMDGKVVSEMPWQHVEREDIEDVLRKNFSGEIFQTPPAYSAKKYNGKRFSDIVRRAGSVEAVSPVPRKVTINSIELTAFDPPYYSVLVSCTSGTYMRSLARDVAERLGTVGYARGVVRHWQGEFTNETALREEDWTIEGVAKAIEAAGRRRKEILYHGLDGTHSVRLSHVPSPFTRRV